MSLIIKGMEMPLRCINCPFKTYYHGDNRCLANRGNPIKFEIGNDRGTNCPLLPLPAGHGMLIDADALCKSVLSQCEMVDALGIPEMSQIANLIKNGLLQEIGNAETIIEAEGGGEDG
jgi:hypothetical protein